MTKRRKVSGLRYQESSGVTNELDHFADDSDPGDATLRGDDTDQHDINVKALQFKPEAHSRACQRGASEVGGNASTHNTTKALIIYILKHVSHSVWYFAESLS